MGIKWVARFILSWLLPCLAASNAWAAPALTPIPSEIDLDLAAYAAQFAQCDEHEIFNGRPVDPLAVCGGDPNQLQTMELLPSGALRYVSKLSLDLDGGWKACNDPGETDQCPTTYVYEDWRNRPRGEQLGDWERAFVTSDTVPYVVIPFVRIAGGKLKRNTDFTDITGISIGDVGVVIQNGLAVPVLVADGGPDNKIGEGSIALFEALEQTRCRSWLEGTSDYCAEIENMSLEGLAQTILFPNSRIADLTPQNTNQRVRMRAMELYGELFAEPALWDETTPVANQISPIDPGGL